MILQDHINGFIAYTRASTSNGTWTAYEERLKTFTRWLDGRDPNRETITDWISELGQREVSPHTMMAYVKTIRSLFDWVKDQGFISENPVPKFSIRLPASSKIPITELEYVSMLNACTGYWRYAIVLAWGTGLRMSDIALLKWENVNMELKEITLSPMKTRGLGKTISIPMSNSVHQLFVDIWMTDTHRPEDFVSPKMSKSYLSTSGHHEIGKQFKELGKKARISPSKTFHCFRHSFITRHIDAGVSPAIVASMTGQTLQEVMTYCKVSMETKRRALI